MSKDSMKVIIEEGVLAGRTESEHIAGSWTDPLSYCRVYMVLLIAVTLYIYLMQMCNAETWATRITLKAGNGIENGNEIL
jgi:hypothetical protein